MRQRNLRRRLRKTFRDSEMLSGAHSLRIPAFRHALLGGVWMSVLLSAIAWLSAVRGASLLVLPFGATLAILLYLPDADIARPRAVILGSILGASTGTALTGILGADASTAIVAALAAALVLRVLRVYHPPGIALALYAALLHSGWSFTLEVVLPFTFIAVLSVSLVLRRIPRQSSERSQTRHPTPFSEELHRNRHFDPYQKVSKRIRFHSPDIP